MTETSDSLLFRISISIKGDDFREVREEKQKKQYCCYEMVTNLIQSNARSLI